MVSDALTHKLCGPCKTHDAGAKLWINAPSSVCLSERSLAVSHTRAVIRGSGDPLIEEKKEKVVLCLPRSLFVRIEAAFKRTYFEFGPVGAKSSPTESPCF